MWAYRRTQAGGSVVGDRHRKGPEVEAGAAEDDARRVLDLQSRRIAYEQVCVELCLGKIDTWN